jgi:hypothetical protein
MLNNTSLYYKESGKVPPAGAVIALVLGSLAAAILSVIYAYATNYIPIIYLNFLLTIGLGAGVGFAVGKGAEIGKIRSKKIVIILSVLVALVASYAAWVTAVYLWMGSELLLLNPLDLFEMIQIAAEEGVWSFKGSTPTGAALYGVWAVEIIVIIGGAAMAGLRAYPSEPFCESCDKWTKQKELTNHLDHPEDLEAFVKALEAKNFDPLTVLRNAGLGNPIHLKVGLLDCPSCPKVHYLTITLIVATIKDDGKVETEETILVENLSIDAKVHQELMAWHKKIDEKPPVVLTTETTSGLEEEEDSSLEE